MLKREELLEGMDKKYHKMLSEVNIADFTKTIWVWSGDREATSDAVIREYLQTWATNKYPLYKTIGGIRKDTPIDFEPVANNDDVRGQYLQIAKDFPAYAPWLITCFEDLDKEGKIVDDYSPFKSYVVKTFPGAYESMVGMKITGFLSKFLRAPEELITQVAAIYEFKRIKGTYTLSIDPVDIMLASENPYGWRSCYALDGEYADGLMASVLDPQIAIGYIWERDGVLVIGSGEYKLKNIRYKRMRQWVVINEDSAGFCKMYPGKDNVGVQLQAEARNIVGKIINPELNWYENKISLRRVYSYGYSEFVSLTGIFGYEGVCKIEDVYSVQIKCPCGCGEYLPDEKDSYSTRYSGDGFICNNFYEEEEYYCDICDTYYYDGDDCACRYCEECDERIHPGEYEENGGRCNYCAEAEREREEAEEERLREEEEERLRAEEEERDAGQE